MATAADVDLRGWTRQSSTPKLDGSFPASVRAIGLSLIASKVSGIAPLGVVFDASDSTATDGSDPKESIIYDWDYGDAGATFENLPSKDATSSRGFLGSHVFKSAGTYTVTLTSTDKLGATQQRTVDIVVSDPEVEYTETYYVSTSSTYPGGTAAEYQLTSFAEAKTILDNLRFDQNSNPTRVLFRAGESFSLTSGAILRDTTAEVYIGRYDTGADPILAPASSMTSGSIFELNNADNVTFENLDVNGDYDPTTGLGAHPTGIFTTGSSSGLLVHNCSLSGLGVTLYPGGTGGKHVIADNVVSDWQDYGLFGSFGGTASVLANIIKQNPSAVSGTEGKVGTAEPNYPDHGCIRTASPERLLIQHNDMFNNAGWSSTGLAHQACLRLGSIGSSSKCLVADNDMEGGYSIISCREATGAALEGLCDSIFERNTLVATGNTQTHFEMYQFGSIIRNNMLYKDDNGAPSIGFGQYKSGVSLGADRPDTSVDTEVTRIYNNTLISHATDAADTGLVTVASAFTDIDIYNNIIYLASSSGDSGLLDIRFAADKTNYKSDYNIVYSPSSTVYVDDNGTTKTLAAWRTSDSEDANSSTSDPVFVSNTSLTGALNVGSPALDSGYDLGIAIDSLDQTIRTATYNIGAWDA